LLYKNCVLPLINSEGVGVTYYNSASHLNVNNTYLVDTKLGEVTLILPPNPEPGDYISFVDVNNTWNINNLSILNNTKKINNKEENLIVNINNILLTLIYCGTESYYGWNIVVNNTC